MTDGNQLLEIALARVGKVFSDDLSITIILIKKTATYFIKQLAICF